ncbi:MAG: DUF2089 domain-containing protein [Chloroflexi bacterium]|nr:DUF2089 domain-containing protein [Chloroflexota bacterium]
MHALPNECPVCGGELVLTHVRCWACDTELSGRFHAGPFTHLNEEQLVFVELFVRNEGKITRMEQELGLSYPTIRNRLHEVIRALGYEPGADDFAGLSEEERRQILDDLDGGKIDYQEALRLIEEKEAK